MVYFMSITNEINEAVKLCTQTHGLVPDRLYIGSKKYEELCDFIMVAFPEFASFPYPEFFMSLQIFQVKQMDHFFVAKSY